MRASCAYTRSALGAAERGRVEKTAPRRLAGLGARRGVSSWKRKIDDRPRGDEGDSEADMFRYVINIIRAQRDRDARAKEGKPSEKGDRIGVYPAPALPEASEAQWEETPK